MPNAVQTIRNQHRALNSVLSALLVISRKALRAGGSPDFPWLWTLLEYVDRSSERLHHPKEDLYLFQTLERRCPDIARQIARLRREHVTNAGYIVRLCDALVEWEFGYDKAGPVFVGVAGAFVRFNWRHTCLEEREILPVALKMLSAADWEEIDRAYATNTDPLAGSGTREECEAALRRLLSRQT